MTKESHAGSSLSIGGRTTPLRDSPRTPAQSEGSAAAAAAADPSDCAGVRGESLSGVVLPPMDSDEPAWLSFVIARYLDEEWIEQPVHKEIGEAVGRLYEKSRAEGDDDLIAVLAALSYGLKDMWSGAGFLEAFEGPVDVANRAAELLMLRLGREVWSYGRSNSDVQKKMLARLKEYEAARSAIGDAARAEG
mmetsp:Transcript_99115/g.309149  ORF Transcript_99115/g.309149 Transcript_99115/m.309149 type:complete len:192 (-) Transcript_99115:45-620(-)